MYSQMVMHVSSHSSSRNAAEPSRADSGQAEVGFEPPFRPIKVALAALYRRCEGGTVEFLIARRHREAIQGGLWEFPGGKIEPGELPCEAALREVHEELGLAGEAFAGTIEPLIVVTHSDPRLARERCVELHAFFAEVKPHAVPKALRASELRWIGVEEISQFEWPAANAPINNAIAAIFKSPPPIDRDTR